MKYSPLLILILFLGLSGCSTYSASRYSISADNVTKLRAYSGTKFSVGEFTSSIPSKSEIMCRGVGPIKTPDGENFEQFVRKAFIDELQMAEVYFKDGAIILTGNLNSIDFSSNSGNWDISLSVTSSNGKSLDVSENYSYDTSFYGETACNQTAHALMPAVQNLISKLINHDSFASLIEV